MKPAKDDVCITYRINFKKIVSNDGFVEVRKQRVHCVCKLHFAERTRKTREATYVQLESYDSMLASTRKSARNSMLASLSLGLSILNARQIRFNQLRAIERRHQIPENVANILNLSTDNEVIEPCPASRPRETARYRQRKHALPYQDEHLLHHLMAAQLLRCQHL
jgi:hypothetical protein